MATKKIRKEVYFERADLHRLDTLRLELQNPLRRGEAHYQPKDEGLSEFIVRLALTQAYEIEQELLEQDS